MSPIGRVRPLSTLPATVRLQPPLRSKGPTRKPAPRPATAKKE